MKKKQKGGMTEAEYTRVASRGAASGSLHALYKCVDEFRWNAEAAGISVNTRVIGIKQWLDEFSREIQQASFQDRQEIQDRRQSE